MKIDSIKKKQEKIWKCKIWESKQELQIKISTTEYKKNGKEISGVEDTIKDIYSSVKENDVQSKIF